MAGEKHGSRMLRALAALAAAVFFARALVPAGYMLTPTEGGAAIVFCDGHEVSAAPAHHVHMAGAMPARHSEHGKHQQHDGVCAFSASADLSNTGVAHTPAFIAFTGQVVEAPIAVGNPRLDLAAPPPPARGPPLSV